MTGVLGRLLRGLQRSELEAPAGGLPWSDLYPTRPAAGLRPRSYAPPLSVAASTSQVTLALANAARRALVVVNDSSTAYLYVGLGAIASPSSFDAKLGPGQVLVLEPPDTYRGDVVGVWDVATGAARVTETT